MFDGRMWVSLVKWKSRTDAASAFSGVCGEAFQAAGGYEFYEANFWMVRGLWGTRTGQVTGLIFLPLGGV
jgi:hypothetical protein